MGRAARAVRTAGFLAAAAGACAWLAASPAADVPQPRRPDPAPAPPAAAPIATPAPAPIPGSALGLILYGVSGGGSAEPAAIVGSGSGGQRLVRVGKDFHPGLTLTEVGPDYAILVTGGRPARLKLRRFGEPSKGDAPRIADSEMKRGIEAAVLRNILRPVASGGYALSGGQSLPKLQKAGLRAGDVILSVNGSRFDEERMSELAWEMQNASKTAFVFERDGKRMRAST
ncbi:MAG TPA: type II secretion system protein N [Allosphingosinicella sp.]|nr:type II secretion system protein N [Allosphingosinicella sp.]